MKATETKNYKSLEKVFNDCADKGDTLFAIYGYGKNDGTVIYQGKEDHITIGFITILEKSLSQDADEGSMEVGNAFLNAIQTILAQGDEKSIHFSHMLLQCIEKAQKAMQKSIEAEDSNDRFGPEDEDCIDCEDYGKCMLEYLMGIAKEACIEISPVPQKKNHKTNKKK